MTSSSSSCSDYIAVHCSITWTATRATSIQDDVSKGSEKKYWKYVGENIIMKWIENMPEQNYYVKVTFENKTNFSQKKQKLAKEGSGNKKNKNKNK